MAQADELTHEQPQLKRTLGLFAITAFGVGDILGSGVYALIGTISGQVGSAAWLSYVVAGFTAALTGLTYAEFTSRYPKAGGAAHFVQTVFRSPFITFMVMCFVGLSGMFSMAATSRTFSNYALANAPGVPMLLKDYFLPFAFLLVIAAVAILGIVLSSTANLICTIVEVAGLLIIILLGAKFLGGTNYMEFATPAGNGTSPPFLVMQGAALAFFAFIGFEDMANLSEEVKNPERNVPWAICLAIVITSTVYVCIALIAVSVLPWSVLRDSKSPLLDVVSKASPGFPKWIYSVIPGVAVFNTALLNCLMASRLIYGMARGKNSLLPSALGQVHPRWRTPAIAVGVATVITIIMTASTKQIGVLASGTTVFLLVVFMLLHVALVKTKLTKQEPVPFRIPIFVPILGAISCAGLLVNQKREAIIVALWIGLAALGLFAINWFFRGRRQIEAID